MAYPFAQMPTLGEFVERLTKDFGAESGEAVITGPRGPVTIRYLKRGDEFVGDLPDIEDTDRLAPTVLRSLCARLGVPTSSFGLDLD